MLDSKEILNWNFSPNTFKLTGDRVFSNTTKQDVYRSIQQLHKLTERLPEGAKPPQEKLIKDIYWRFQYNKSEDYSTLLSLFSKRDIRVLVWALLYREYEDEQPILFSDDFALAIKLIIDKWKDSFIISFWYILIKNWSTLFKFNKQRSLLIKTLKKKGIEYDKSRNDIKYIAQNISLFEHVNSPIEYAKKLIDKKILITDAHTLINQKESVLVNNEYYSLVIENYAELLFKGPSERVNNEMLLSVYQYLVKHNSKATTLVVCSSIINNKIPSYFLEIVKSQSVALIADPIKKHQWEYSGLDSDQEVKVEMARQKLNAILNQRLIKVFFERLVEDPRRKRYWLRFIDKIDNIVFVGNRDNYFKLKNIQSVSKEVDSRYKTTYRNQGTCALIIYSKNYVFVEFTDVGALYIYRKQNFNVNLNNISSMEDLKIWSRYEFACRNSSDPGYYSLQQEGRITHQGDWESRVNSWMNRYYD